MKLLFVSHSLPPADAPTTNIGGMQRVALDLHEALSEHANLTYTPLVLRASWDHIERKVARFMWSTLGDIRRRVRRGEVDVVLFSSMVTASLALFLKGTLRKHGVKAASIVHGLDVTQPTWAYQRVLVPRIFSALDAVLPVSRATGEACRARGLPTSKVYVVPNGVRVDRFPPLADRSTMRRQLVSTLAAQGHRLPTDALLLCSVGRQVERKGFRWFIDEVMPKLPDTVHYLLAGAPGPDTPNIEAAIERQHLHNRVRRLGRLSEEDLLTLYRGADLFVMPNIPVAGDMEGFGVVMLEAGLCGLPSVAAALEGIRDVITEGVNGHLVPSGAADAFVRAILPYHATPSALTAASKRAYQHVADTFSWQAIAKQYTSVLRSL